MIFRKATIRNVKVYSDADWAGCPVDRRFTCGYYSFVWGNLETLRSKKQPVVSRSSAEAEFRSFSNGIREGVWLKMVLNELKMGDSHPIEICVTTKQPYRLLRILCTTTDPSMFK